MRRIEIKDGEIVPKDLVHGEEVELGSGFENLPLRGNFVSSAGRESRLSIEKPFRFLGEGTEKLVLSGSIESDSNDALFSGPVRAAVGISIYEVSLLKKCGRVGTPMNGMEEYEIVRRAGIQTTYNWYVSSKDGGICILPNLAEEGVILSTNTRTTEKEAVMVRLYTESIEQQILGILKEAINATPQIKIGPDAYFCILSTDMMPRVILGDFGAGSVSAIEPNEYKVSPERQKELLDRENRGNAIEFWEHISRDAPNIYLY